MAIWSAEIKELERLNVSLIGHFPELEKEMGQLLKTEDENVAMLYSRRCLEIIVTDLCECELKRPRKTEPLKGIIDKLNKEEKVASYIVTSMHGLNSLSTYGAHPKDFDPEQVKPALSNLAIILKWYLNYKGIEVLSKPSADKEAVIVGTGKQAPDVTKLEKSVAILPFKNDSKDEENTYFINGLMEEVLNNLQKIKDLRVISRTSVEQYRNQTKPIPEIAKELGVNYIVEGSGQKYGNAFRLRTQLIMAAKESHLWGESYQQEINDVKDIFSVQSNIAESIAEELHAVMSPEEKQLIEKIPATDLAVYDEYLKARSYWDDFSKESLNKALEFLNSAVEKEPGWAPLYSGLAQVWMGIQQMGCEPPSVAMPEIYNNLNKALELDPDISAAHYLKAMIAHLVEWDWQKSEKEFLEALAINPNDALSRASYAQLLCVLQRTNEGITQGRLALDLDPLNPYVKCLYGAILPCVGDCKTAIDLAEEITVADPGNYLANNVILMAAYPCKEYGKVINAEKYNLAPFNVTEDDMKEIERIFNEQGFIKAYEKILILLEKFAENNPISPSDLAVRYIMADQPEKALDWLEKGYEMHDPTMTYIATKIFNFEPLFNNSRFLGIVKKMNLPLPKSD